MALATTWDQPILKADVSFQVLQELAVFVHSFVLFLIKYFLGNILEILWILECDRHWFKTKPHLLLAGQDLLTSVSLRFLSYKIGTKYLPTLQGCHNVQVRQ